MASFILSTVAFFVASYFAKRYLDNAELPKGMARTLLVFTIALAVSFAVAAVVDWLLA